MTVPFLSIVTGCYFRPKLLARCIESVQAQDDPDWEHVLLQGEHDGIDGFHRRLRSEQHRYHGEYVYLLCDDDMLIVPDFVSGLKRITRECNPHVVMVKADKLEFGILPDALVWDNVPAFGHIDILNYVIRADVWQEMSGSFDRRDVPYYNGAHAGDFSFIRDVFQEPGLTVCWWDRVVARSQRISRGETE